MKRKGIILSIVGILLISTIIILAYKNTDKTFMQDGVLLALTVDGEEKTEFPNYEEGKYTVAVECNNGNGKWIPVKQDNGTYKWELVVENITGDVKCYVDFTTKTDNDNLIIVVESKATSGVDGYRYQGKEPDNWVWFNNELWRIIGSIPTCTESGMSSTATSGTCSQTESDKPNLVKIIRAESIGVLAYHSADSNTIWGSGNTLYTLLNEYYYGKKNATGASPCLGYQTSAYALCNYEEDGISSDSTDYYGQMVKSVYMNAGTVSDMSTVIDAAYDLEIATVSKLTKIGLMSASDYGYATSDITYSGVELSSLYSYTNTNWLYGQGIEKILTPSSASRVASVVNTGNVGSSIAYSGGAVRPSLYLDSSVYVIDGSGTKGDPYIIGM